MPARHRAHGPRLALSAALGRGPGDAFRVVPGVVDTAIRRLVRDRRRSAGRAGMGRM